MSRLAERLPAYRSFSFRDKEVNIFSQHNSKVIESFKTVSKVRMWLKSGENLGSSGMQNF